MSKAKLTIVVTPEFRAELKKILGLPRQLRELLSLSTSIDWIIESLLLPSNDGQTFTLNLNLPPSISIAKADNDNAALLDYLRNSKNKIGAKYTENNSTLIHLIFWAAPTINAGAANRLLYPLTIFNGIFQLFANLLGYLFKGLGDIFTLPAIICMGIFNYLFIKHQSLLSSRPGSPPGVGSWLLGLLIMAICAPIALPCLVVAQPLYMIGSAFHYLRAMVDGIVSLIVSAVGFFITKRFAFFIDENTIYPDPIVSLEAIIKNALLLAPIVIMLVITILPIGGQVGLFVGSAFLNLAVDTGAGLLNFLFISGLAAIFQAYGATMESAVSGIFSYISRLFSTKPATEPAAASVLLLAPAPTTVTVANVLTPDKQAFYRELLIAYGKAKGAMAFYQQQRGEESPEYRDATNEKDRVKQPLTAFRTENGISNTVSEPDRLTIRTARTEELTRLNAALPRPSL